MGSVSRFIHMQQTAQHSEGEESKSQFSWRRDHPRRDPHRTEPGLGALLSSRMTQRELQVPNGPKPEANCGH